MLAKGNDHKYPGRLEQLQEAAVKQIGSLRENTQKGGSSTASEIPAMQEEKGNDGCLH